jgi:PAS domain S-box-containing protein
VESQLSSIATLKINELKNWRSERLADAEIFYKNPAFSELVQRYLGTPADALAQTELQSWLKVYDENKQYDRVFLLDAGGVERISSPATTETVAEHLPQEESAVLSAGQVTFLDFQRDTAGGPIHLEVLAPILANQDNHPLGLLVLRIDPQAYLYPFIQHWPVPSASAETLLVRREGEDVLYLNTLRFKSDAALNLREPLANTEVLAVKAVLGQAGIVEGIDYRGMAVIGDVRAVPDSPWFLVSRMDTAEVYAPLQERLWQTIAFFSTLILAAGAGLALVLWQQRVRFYRARYMATETLRESEEKFRKAFLITPDAITITRLSNGRFVSVNQGFTNILGYADADVVGKSSLELNIWDNPEDRKKMITELEANGIVENYEATFRTKTGDLRYGLISAAIIELNGEHHIINSTRDITERKRSEEALWQLSERQQALLSAIPDIIMEVDHNKVYTWANQAGIEFFGEDVVGKEAAFYFEGEQDTDSVVQALFNGYENVIYIESWQRRKDGEKRLLAWWHRELKDERGNVTGALSSGRDITESKQQEAQILATQAELQELLAKADQSRRTLLSVVEDQKMGEEEIRRLNAELEQRVADRTAQLEVSNKELEAFAYSVSHDLRAPLRAIDGFSCILQNEYAQKLDDEGLRLLGVVRNNTSRMDHLITDLLALSRVSRSELRYSPIDMTTLANSIYHELATPEVLEKFVFKVSDLPRASGDSTLIRQVWANLISNAIKYTLPIADPAVFDGKKECVIEINGWEKDGLCTYLIKDSGVGFNPKYADRLFGLFQRLHKASDFEGTGVGLAIVQRIIHRHSGQVWGEGQVGAGATFYFTLPKRQVNHG